VEKVQKGREKVRKKHQKDEKERKEEKLTERERKLSSEKHSEKTQCTIANTKTNEFFCYFEQKIQIVFFVTNPFYV
jgi:hypothetical protein